MSGLPNPMTDPPCGMCLNRPYRDGMPLCAGCRDQLEAMVDSEPYEPDEYDPAWHGENGPPDAWR